MNEVLIAILSALLSGWVGYRFGLYNAQRQMRNEAAEWLYHVFYPLRNGLANENCDTITLIQPTIKEQETEIAYMKRFLSNREAARLQAAWEAYYCLDNKGQAIPFLEQYADCGSIDKRRQLRPILIGRIDAILAFSKPR